MVTNKANFNLFFSFKRKKINLREINLKVKKVKLQFFLHAKHRAINLSVLLQYLIIVHELKTLRTVVLSMMNIMIKIISKIIVNLYKKLVIQTEGHRVAKNLKLKELQLINNLFSLS